MDGYLPVVTGQYRSETKEFHTSVHLPPQDPRLVYRLVGFVEYGKALELLDDFLRRASLQEIEIADEIVRENDQFLVYTNLSRQMEKPNLLSEPGRNARDDFARRGLRWVLALARVEFGAMLAGFSTAAKPFVLVAPKPQSPRFPNVYGAEEFAELLLDGTRMHYWSLKNDPAVWNYYKTGVPGNHPVTYGRRVIVARHFLVAARQFFARSLNKAQHAVLNQWEQELTKIHRMLLYCLSKKVGDTRTTHVKSSLSNFDFGPNPGWKSQKKEEFKRTRNRSPLHEVLLLIDPTLITCPCR